MNTDHGKCRHCKTNPARGKNKMCTPCETDAWKDWKARRMSREFNRLVKWPAPQVAA